MDLPKRLTEFREKKGLTQAQLAEEMDVSRQTVSRWELGEVAPSAEKLIKLSEIFGVSLDYLVRDNAARPENGAGKQDPPAAKSSRGVIALLLAVIVILTLALVMGHFSRKGGDNKEEVIPVGKLQEEKIVVSPESRFSLTWGD